jgi:hypothetical protein
MTPRPETQKPAREAEHAKRLHVVLEGDLLTMTEATRLHNPSQRLYAQRTIDFEDLTAFTILPKLPKGASDKLFRPAIGTVILYVINGKYRMRAAGRYLHGKTAGEWSFDAIESFDE